MLLEDNRWWTTKTVEYFCLCWLACMAVVFWPITRGEQKAWEIRNGWRQNFGRQVFRSDLAIGNETTVAQVNTGLWGTSQLSLQFLYFLNGKGTFIWHSLALLGFLFGRSGKWEQRIWNFFKYITFIYIEVQNITLLTDLFYIYITYIESSKYKRKTNFQHLHNTKILHVSHEDKKIITTNLSYILVC